MDVRVNPVSVGQKRGVLENSGLELRFPEDAYSFLDADKFKSMVTSDIDRALVKADGGESSPELIYLICGVSSCASSVSIFQSLVLPNRSEPNTKLRQETGIAGECGSRWYLGIQGYLDMSRLCATTEIRLVASAIYSQCLVGVMAKSSRYRHFCKVRRTNRFLKSHLAQVDDQKGLHTFLCYVERTPRSRSFCCG